MSSLVEQIQELLEDYRAVGEQVWEEAEDRARSFVAGGVSEGRFRDLTGLDGHREQLTRSIVLEQTVSFLTREGLGGEVERVMTANGQGFTEADLANLDDGIMPDREQIEAFRIRSLLAHYALVCDAQAIQAGLISAEGT